MLMFSLPLLAEFEPETVLEDFTNRLKRHALDIRVEEHDKQPAEKADAAVEAEGSRRRDPLHHGEKCTADDDVCAPASAVWLAKVLILASSFGEAVLTYVTVLSIVPKARASLGINSVPIQAMVATPVE
jgi:hypothetical protein